MLARSKPGKPLPFLVVLACIGLAACGSSGPKLPAATRVCQGGLHAFTRVVGAASLTIADRDPGNIECLITGSGLRLDVVAQSSAAAWTEFDTLVSHQAQGFEVTHPNSSSMPQDLAGLGYNAAWVGVDGKLLATNGSQTQGGSFVTITVTGRGHDGPTKLRVAQAVATATLASAPRGPNPGPPPS